MCAHAALNYKSKWLKAWGNHDKLFVCLNLHTSQKHEKSWISQVWNVPVHSNVITSIHLHFNNMVDSFKEKLMRKKHLFQCCCNVSQLILLLCVWGCLMNTENTYRHFDEFSLWVEVQTAWVVAHGHILEMKCAVSFQSLRLTNYTSQILYWHYLLWAPVDTASIKIGFSYLRKTWHQRRARGWSFGKAMCGTV